MFQNKGYLIWNTTRFLILKYETDKMEHFPLFWASEIADDIRSAITLEYLSFV